MREAKLKSDLSRYVPYPSETAEFVFNISDRYKYCFVALPKCGSTGMIRALQLAEVDGDEGAIPAFTHDRRSSPLLTFSTTSKEPDEILTGPYFRFTYVRNPFTRILSAYLDKICNEEPERERLAPELGLPPDRSVPFIEFLKAVRDQRDHWRDIHFTTQSRILQKHNIPYHFIGRYESWKTTFPRILLSLGIDAEIAQPGTARHSTRATQAIHEFIGHAECDLILSIYEADFINFCYGPNPGLSLL